MKGSGDKVAKKKRRFLFIWYDDGSKFKIELLDGLRWFINTEEGHVVVGRPLEDPIYIANFNHILHINEMEV